jgi:uncharacterized membrane protein YidH (DUF202 family)
LPGLKVGPALSLKLLGLGYGVLAVAVLVIGAARQNRVADALRRGSFDRLSSGLVNWLTAAAVALGVVTIAVVAAAL